MKVVGQKGTRYLIALFSEVDEKTLPFMDLRAVVLNTATNYVSPSGGYYNALSHGEWQPATMPEAELYQRLAMATHQPGRDGTPAKDLIPAEIK